MQNTQLYWRSACIKPQFDVCAGSMHWLPAPYVASEMVDDMYICAEEQIAVN